MIQSCETIERLLGGLSAQSLAMSESNYLGIRHELIIVGEAAFRLPATFRQTHSTIDWQGPIGLRHKLVHGYETVDPERVWEIATQDTPFLREALLSLLATLQR